MTFEPALPADRLPIDDALPRLRAALAGSACAVLVAPPGAGKTTRVPLALAGESWLGGRRILVMEPRRVAARGAAQRMAATLGEQVGERIGLRARLSTLVSARTRIEVVTEGVFTRMILDDPMLEGIGALLFDEFHERSLDADLGLALALDAQSGLREDLRILVMSATLDGARVAALMGSAPVIASSGRAFPVETRYLPRDRSRPIEEAVARAVHRTLIEEAGSILAFLPGQREIRRTAEHLERIGLPPNVAVAPLHGALDAAAQDQAVRPAASGRRKVVLATAIAETSLTIEDVRVVVDCGLARVPRYEPDVAVTRLQTVRVSRASADQRRGRAGRTGPGICYRLWSEAETQSLTASTEPEIRSADLAALLLDCAAWGLSDPLALRWLDPPPAAALAAARSGLIGIAALDADGRLTGLGQRMRAIPLPPRLARMVIAAADAGSAKAACELAAVIVERSLGGSAVDIAERIAAFRLDRGRRAEDARKLAAGWARQALASRAATPTPGGPDPSPAALLAIAYPDRIAKARGRDGRFLLANGRGARLDPCEPLASAEFLVAAELQGEAADTRVLLAAELESHDLESIAATRATISREIDFDAASRSVRFRRVRRLDAIVLSSEPLAAEAGPETARVLAEAIARTGLGLLPWTPAQLRLRDRVAFLRRTCAEGLPDLTDAALADNLQSWLGPKLQAITSIGEISSADLAHGLDPLLPWRLRQSIDRDAPTHFEAPTGNRHVIDYSSPDGPAIHIRVQELYGLKAHPTVAAGRMRLLLHLLSPAHRSIQITRDLPGFWAGSWAAVRAEMRGRYPKHPWPEDPANAQPTARARPRGD